MIQVKLLTETSKVPVKAHESDAGYDVCSNENIIIPAGERYTVKTGISLAIPNLGNKKEDIYIRVAPRSGLAVNHGLHVLAGVVDRGYRGEIGVPLLNTGKEDYTINIGDRIAQLIPTLIYKDDMVVVTELDSTDRNNNGLGSTGK